VVLIARCSKWPFGHADILTDMSSMAEVDLIETLHLIVTNPAWIFNSLVKILVKIEMSNLSGCKQS